ncbi:ABC transporter ATP-binding protein [bacterium]|nr:ABC transporter ATP-binding protein [bacterium]
MKQHALEISNLRKMYKGELGEKDVLGLDDLTLTIPRGEVFAFIGPNGAGKTTTIKLLMRLMFPTSGSVMILGESNASRRAMRKIGFLPEQPRMYEYLTGREFLDFTGRLFSLGKEERLKRSDLLLKRVGLGERGNALIRSYSRGMMQRLGLAQALMNEPEIVILDEPMASLDPVGRKDFRDTILQLKAQGKTIFFSSHILSDAEMIADRVGILKEGRLQRVADLEALTDLGTSAVEVTFRLDQEKQGRIGDSWQKVAVQGGQVMIRLPDRKQLSRLLSDVQSWEGEIISVVPVRQSLEDIFMAELGR